MALCVNSRKSYRRTKRRLLPIEALESRSMFTVEGVEQYFVYRLNYARHDPAAYAVEQGLSVPLTDVTPRGPLAVNDSLFESAEVKSEDMSVNDYFSHPSPISGLNANALVRSAGYPLPTSLSTGQGNFLFPDDGAQTESIAAGWSTADEALNALIVDGGPNSPRQRNQMLGIDQPNSLYREVGVGYAFVAGTQYENYWTVHTAAQDVLQQYITGVVYRDDNDNSRYDIGEGLPNVRVEITGLNSVDFTNAAGGYSLLAQSGIHTVQASGGNFVGTSFVNVGMGNDNVEVDFRSGRSGAQVNFVDVGGQLPQLSVTLDPGNVTESAGTGAVTGTITRTGDLGSSVTVSVNSGDTTELTVQTAATIPAGQSSVTFSASPVNDGFADGTQTVIVTVSANGYAPGQGTILVTDSQGATLTFNGTSVIEGNSIRGTLRRPVDGEPFPPSLTFTLTTSNGSIAVPAQVTVIAGQATALFDATAIDNALIDGNRQVTIYADAPGFSTATAVLTIVDNETVQPPNSGWHNSGLLRSDVDGNTDVDPQDILYVAFEVANRIYSDSNGLITSPPLTPPLYLDVNGDGYIDVQDIAFVVYDYNARSAAGSTLSNGESSPPASKEAIHDEALLFFLNGLDAERRNREPF